MKKRRLTILDLPFISILDRRPADGQFILMAWDIGGYCGYESTNWDSKDRYCQHAVAWMALSDNHILGRVSGARLANKSRNNPVLLKWHNHYSTVINDKYVSKDKLIRTAYVEQFATK